MTGLKAFNKLSALVLCMTAMLYLYLVSDTYTIQAGTDEEYMLVPLEEESQDFTYEWESDGTEAVALRFSGEGKTTLSSAFLSNKIEVSQVGAEFGKEYTIFLNQPGKDEYDDCLGALELLDKNDKQITDNNLGSQGIQVLDGQYVKVRYWDPDGGSFFDGFILKDKDQNDVKKYESGKEIPLKDNPLKFTMGKDQKPIKNQEQTKSQEQTKNREQTKTTGTKTGDDSQTVLWILLACAGIFAAAETVRRKREFYH